MADGITMDGAGRHLGLHKAAATHGSLFLSAARPDLPGGIEPGRENANEQRFPVAGRFFRRTFIPFNAGDAMQQPDHAAGKPLRIRDAIAGQSLAQIPRLAHVQDSSGSFAHEIDARARGQGAKEIIAQPLDERLGWIKKPKLPRGHADISTQRQGHWKSKVHTQLDYRAK